jgi:hypothetical protein
MTAPCRRARCALISRLIAPSHRGESSNNAASSKHCVSVKATISRSRERVHHIAQYGIIDAVAHKADRQRSKQLAHEPRCPSLCQIAVRRADKFDAYVMLFHYFALTRTGRAAEAELEADVKRLWVAGMAVSGRGVLSFQTLGARRTRAGPNC